MQSAVFIDRDGVIVENRDDYVRSWSEVRFIPGALEALEKLGQSTYAVVLVTNQSAVGRGLISLEEAQEINRRVVAQIRAHGGRMDAVYMCPHRPDEGCSCRKPAPGMLMQAARERDLDLASSTMIGDALSDLAAARAAGVRGVLVLTGRGSEQAGLDAASVPGDGVPVADLAAAVDGILRAQTSGKV
jgi:D-glycero-D-manno-heptose 1,7-bisphosphate phosphatase